MLGWSSIIGSGLCLFSLELAPQCPSVLALSVVVGEGAMRRVGTRRLSFAPMEHVPARAVALVGGAESCHLSPPLCLGMHLLALL